MRFVLGLLLAATALTGCGSATNTAGSGAGNGNGKLRVVAAENFWGSIATQIGGDKVEAVSIVTRPDTDPHDYEPTAADSRTVAQADIVIVNGVGYDSWADKLIAANPNPKRKVINVGNDTQHKEGDNPHRWYSPGDVLTVVNSITNAMAELDGNNTAYYDTGKHNFDTNALGHYNETIDYIKSHFDGQSVGATESIFSPLADALGLHVLTPDGFLTAISEGSDPPAAEKTEADEQIQSNQIKVLVYNSQNATPDVQLMLAHARAAKIPIVAVTETLSPAGASFQDWQSAQLDALKAALGSRAGG